MSEQNKSFLLLFFKKEEVFFLERKKQRTFVPFAVAGALFFSGAAFAGERLSVCIDSASATASRDQKIAEAVAQHEGLPLSVEHFDGASDDDGVTAKQFQKLLSTKCQLVMGYPVDLSDASAPPGILETRAYDETGFVLVVPNGAAARKLADFPKDTKVAVTFETAPNLYFLAHPNVRPDVHEQDAETLQSVIDGKVPAAMVWQPTVQAYLAAHPGAGLGVYKLSEPHARWNVVALYTASSADAAKRFENAVTALQTSATSPDGFDPKMVHRQNADGFDPSWVVRAGVDATPPNDPPPALYTTAQATAGAAHYAALCSVCHGPQLQGLVGPALKGPNFASVKAGFAVGDIFTIVANNMPASDPGTLAPDIYVKIMAFLLQQNGYPAGSTPLTFAIASNSNVKLIYRGQ